MLKKNPCLSKMASILLSRKKKIRRKLKKERKRHDWGVRNHFGISGFLKSQFTIYISRSIEPLDGQFGDTERVTGGIINRHKGF